jgi:hypothetical protein
MMSRLAAAVLTILLLGCGTYVLAATGGGPSGSGSAAIVQYGPTTPETPTYQTSTPKPKSEEKSQEPDESQIGGEKRGDRGPSAGAQPETRSTSAPVETAATGPAGGATGLPFTGFELLALVVTGLLLLGLGLVPQMLRRSR